MSPLSNYLDEKRRLLARDYQANCLTIAREIAMLLIDAGKRPFIACLHKEEIRPGYRFHYPLIPKKYEGKITWTKHYVCCCDGVAYDPMLAEPVPIEQYSLAVFGEEFPMEIFVAEEAMREHLSRHARQSARSEPGMLMSTPPPSPVDGRP